MVQSGVRDGAKWFALNQGEDVTLEKAVAFLFKKAQSKAHLKVVTKSGSNRGKVYSNVYGPSTDGQGGHVKQVIFSDEIEYHSAKIYGAGYIELKFMAEEPGTILLATGIGTSFEGLPMPKGPYNLPANWQNVLQYFGIINWG